MVKILSVDDETDLEVLLSQYFRRRIRKGDFEFAFAHNGLEALKILLEHPDFDIILSDINMPEMDGLTLLTKVNELRNPALKCIMVSAYGDMGNIRTAMNRGAFDFATKPIDLQDLERTIDKAAEQIAFIKEAEREHSQLDSIRYDLDIAREIQTSVLPKKFPPFPGLKTVDLYASMKAAKSVGGDFYDFFLIDDQHLGIVMADVSDKGVPAAIFMAISRTVIRATALEEKGTAMCMEKANALLCRESVNSMFVTVFYGILNVETGELTYTNAGHNAPVVVRKNSKVEFLQPTGDVVLGISEPMSFHEKQLNLIIGDRLFLYTDGVTEAMNGQYEQFGEEHLLEVCGKMSLDSPQEMVKRIEEAVADFVNGAEQSDDITMMGVVFDSIIE